ncbi:hypothetical protein H4R19_004052 [Coemansia spiralis]|nr:hypothetical protein H4R19_004052 [Coemansia spiralis]
MSLAPTHGRSASSVLGSASAYSLRGWVDGPSYTAAERLPAGSMSRLWPLPGLNRRSTLPCDAPSLPAAVGELLDGGFCDCLSDISEVASTCSDGDTGDAATGTQLDYQRRYLHQPITTGADAIPEWSQMTPSFHPAAMPAPQPRGRRPWRALGRQLRANTVPSTAHKRLSTTTRQLARSISAPFGLGAAGDQPGPSPKRRRSWLGSIGRRLQGNLLHHHDDDATMPIMAAGSPSDDRLDNGWDNASISSHCTPEPQLVPAYPRLRSQPPRPSISGPCGGCAPTPRRQSVPAKRRVSRFFLA